MKGARRMGGSIVIEEWGIIIAFNIKMNLSISAPVRPASMLHLKTMPSTVENSLPRRDRIAEKNCKRTSWYQNQEIPNGNQAL